MSDEAAVEGTRDAAGPGELLRVARERKGLAQREAADLLNLPCRFVTAMEEDAFERLPAATFARGYLRAYARLLNLDADEVLTRYARVAPPEPVEVVHRPPRRPMIDPSWLLIAAAVVVLGVSSGVGWMLFGGEEGSPGEAADQSGSLPALPAPGAPSEVAASDSAPSVGPAPVQAAETRSEPFEPDLETNPGGLAPAPDQPPRSPGIARQGKVIEVDTGFGDDVLEISYREDCWTEIHDLDGAVIFQDLVRGNRRLKVTGAAPFRILLGYAGGASVTLNGQEVALGPHTRDGVANLVVGQ